ncbi:FMN-binding protein [Acidaminobacter hydrogenoformans]|uniref:FMN-binding domain-containing protein n=1 Tax=Acidaminobacter hydrogenoformans DSM 2784 TaxID=1120920 RepID=A0A1G5RQC9_9FIRM|nr:FMN-binding protein [Acidaminobacter hydrogenoformans]SCZ76312.1 FMN-binding domain-containing protein [Acidaminobacter hydrogenoformans DSM 2784]
MISRFGGIRTITRTVLLIAVSLTLVMGVAGCKIQKDIYAPGSYEGVSEGYHGPIRVMVTTDAQEIESIVIVEEHEKQVLGDVVDIVYETIPERVRRNNSTEVDVVSGATLTSTALIKAIQDGLDKALLESAEASEAE